MLELLGKDPHVELGGHTINHPHLSWLSADESRREIEGCRTRLRERLGAPIRHFAFPFGRRGDCGEREFEFTRQAGYATAATTRKGLVGDRDKTRLHSLPRNTLNGSHRTTAHVDVHLSGLSGVIARGLNAT
jgi:peptidoglycan/xylan/chitin deacetylase (PgdA/CDA1 family)